MASRSPSLFSRTEAPHPVDGACAMGAVPHALEFSRWRRMRALRTLQREVLSLRPVPCKCACRTIDAIRPTLCLDPIERAVADLNGKRVILDAGTGVPLVNDQVLVEIDPDVAPAVAAVEVDDFGIRRWCGHQCTYPGSNTG